MKGIMYAQRLFVCLFYSLQVIYFHFDAARYCEQLQRSVTLRGADAIADHGVEKVDTVETTTAEIFSRPLPLGLIIFLFSFSRLYLNRVAQKKCILIPPIS